MLKSWGQFQVLVHELPKSEINDMKTYFNGLDELVDRRLGDCLVGDIDKDQVETQVLTISSHELFDNFTNHLLQTGLIDKNFER